MEFSVHSDNGAPGFGLPGLTSARHVADDISCAARTGVAVLISGRREVAIATARQVHDRQPKRSAFVVVDGGRNDGTLSRRLAEALREPSPGGRTVFLPDVDRLNRSQQSLLASYLHRAAVKLRNEETVRIIASTDVDLFDRVNAGAFDRDLFYRLNTIHIVVGRPRQRFVRHADARHEGGRPDTPGLRGRRPLRHRDR